PCPASSAIFSSLSCFPTPLSYLLTLSFPWPIPRIPYPFPYIEPRGYPNELFNQVIRCMKVDIVRKPPRRELSGRDARETGGLMSEVAGQSKYCVFCTNNPSDSSLYFVHLVDNFHPSEF